MVPVPPAVPSMPEPQQLAILQEVLQCDSFAAVEKQLLQPLRAVTGASGAVFIEFNDPGDESWVIDRYSYSGCNPQSADSYFGQYHFDRDPLARAGMRWVRQATAPVRPRVLGLHQLPEWQTLQKSSYFHEFLLPNDVGHIMAILLPVRSINDGLMCVGLHRTRDEPGFGALEQQLLESFSLAIGSVFRNLAAEHAIDVSAQMLEALTQTRANIGLLVFDDDLALKHVTKTAIEQLDISQAGYADLMGELRQVLLQMEQAALGRQSFRLSASSNRVLEFEAWAVTTRRGERCYMVMLSEHETLRLLGERGRKYGLTEREVDVAALLGAGASNGMIAQRLAISVRTVENHLRAIYAKCRVNSRMQLVAMLLAE